MNIEILCDYEFLKEMSRIKPPSLQDLEVLLCSFLSKCHFQERYAMVKCA